MNTSTVYESSNSSKNESMPPAVDSDELHQQPLIIVFIFGCCGLGAVLRILLRKWADLVDKKRFGKIAKIPYTVFLLLIGMGVAAIGKAFPEVQKYLITDVDPDLFFHIFLPVVIFESAYVIDIHVFRRSVGNVSILAVPGLLTATLLTAFLGFIIPEIASISNINVKMYIALMFGAIVSATDPIAVVAMLKDLGCQKYLSIIIEGEALLNDGSAIVIFKICLELLKASTPYYEELTAASFIAIVLQKLFLGPVIGYVSAMLAGFILQQIYNDALSEITVTLSCTYLTFYIGEQAQSSGVLAVVILGLALDRSAITPQVDHFLHRFWEMLAYLANTLIFVLVGVIIVQYIDFFTVADFGYLMILYVGVIVIRAISVFTFYPLMNKFGVEMNWKHMIVMTWGGLKGAVGLILALFLNGYAVQLSPPDEMMPFNNSSENNSYFASQIRLNNEEINFQEIFLKILLYTGGIVFLTLFINASTTEIVLTKLGMLEVSAAEKAMMLSAVHKIQNIVKRNIVLLKCDRFLADSKWKMVEDFTRIETPYKSQPATEVFASEQINHELFIENSDILTNKDIFEEARLRMLKALKMSYNKQYSQGLIFDHECRTLIAAANKKTDHPGEFIDIEHVRKAWKITGFLPYVKHKLEHWMYGKKIALLIPPRNHHRRKVFRLVTSEAFDVFMQFVIFLNIIPIVLDFLANSNWSSYTQWLFGLQVTNYVFLGIYTVEIFLRFMGLGVKQFRKNRWILFDCIILLIGFGELIADAVVAAETTAARAIANKVKAAKLIRAGRIIRALRATRLLRLTKTVMPRAVDFINLLIMKRLHAGYNVGKGFITAEEEAIKLVACICHNHKIQAKLLRASVRNRLTVIKEMGLLQRNYPGIATSVKTRNAIRILLNHSKEVIQQLFSGGILDETELQLLEQNIEIKQKRLANFPTFMPPSEKNDIVQSIVWIKDDPFLFNYVMQNAVDMFYDYEEVIIDEEETFDGIHIIIEGLVKMQGSGNGDLVHSLHRRISDISHHSIEDNSYVGHGVDFRGPGSCFGIWAILTNGYQRSTVSCETAVQTFFLSVEKMVEAFSLFSHLRNNLWKVIAVQIATPIYQEHFDYQGVELVRIHLHLSQGNIVELNNEQRGFTFTSMLVEAVLVFGTVIVDSTQEILEAPALLLPDFEKVTLHWCSFAVLLVIPKDDDDQSEGTYPALLSGKRLTSAPRGQSKAAGAATRSQSLRTSSVPVSPLSLKSPKVQSVTKKDSNEDSKHV